MQINRDQAAEQSDYNGQTYYFCSAGCKKKFDADPQRYTPQAAEQK